eukprot:984678-Pyramimonas_sp.AAC.1
MGPHHEGSSARSSSGHPHDRGHDAVRVGLVCATLCVQTGGLTVHPGCQSSCPDLRRPCQRSRAAGSQQEGQELSQVGPGRAYHRRLPSLRHDRAEGLGVQ